LEKILQDCGLRKNQTYFTQENLKDENEKNIRPDVIVKLPDNKCIVIDAKVTLNAYQDYCNCEDENLKAQHAKKFQQDIERTLKDLSSKEYHKYVQNDTIESVVMFIPIEPAYILALQQDPNLFARAIEKRVIIASPYNIMAILKIVDIMWQVQKYNKNSEEIAKQGGDLIDKFQDLLGRIADLEKSFNGVTNNFSAIKTSIEGKGNLLYKVKELKRLGVVASKKPDKTSDLLTQFHDEDDLTSSTATAAPIDTLL
jgi:DNA recombination protein RmuC